MVYSQLLLRHGAGTAYRLYELADAWPAALRQRFTPPWNQMLLDSVYVGRDGAWYGVGESSYFQYETADGQQEQTTRLYGRFCLHFPGELPPAARQQLEQAYLRQQTNADPALADAVRRAAGSPPPHSKP
ncbi:MAG: hypothetical protein ACRYFX_08410 [Janthinobacterium lividum]